jgi:hypothetical protein
MEPEMRVAKPFDRCVDARKVTFSWKEKVARSAG